MAAPGGPDDETWAKMGKRSRTVYIVLVTAFWLVFLGLLAKKFLFS